MRYRYCICTAADQFSCLIFIAHQIPCVSSTYDAINCIKNASNEREILLFLVVRNMSVFHYTSVNEGCTLMIYAAVR